jgi:homogentisate 1,2-dioxygenase
MVDTFKPLKLTQAALDVEDDTYAYSWQPEFQHTGGDGQVQSEEPASP